MPSPTPPSSAEGVPTAFVALGGNVGSVLACFERALALMTDGGMTVGPISSAYRTEAWVASPGGTAPDYWNAVVGVHTEQEPEVLLASLLEIEANCGRKRSHRWASRTLDLDLLLYGGQTWQSPSLILPHPALSQRPFVLKPLQEIAPKQAIPPDGQTVSQALMALPNPEAGICERRVAWWVRGTE